MIKLIYQGLIDTIKNMLGSGFDTLMKFCLIIGVILVIAGIYGMWSKYRRSAKSIFFLAFGVILIFFSVRYGSIFTPVFDKGGGISF